MPPRRDARSPPRVQPQPQDQAEEIRHQAEDIHRQAEEIREIKVTLAMAERPHKLTFFLSLTAFLYCFIDAFVSHEFDEAFNILCFVVGFVAFAAPFLRPLRAW